MNYITVVLIKNGVVDQSFLFVGNDERAKQQAEAKFLSLLHPADPPDMTWKDNILDDGYFEWEEITPTITISGGHSYAGSEHSFKSCCITWPEVNQVDSEYEFDQIGPDN